MRAKSFSFCVISSSNAASFGARARSHRLEFRPVHRPRPDVVDGLEVVERAPGVVERGDGVVEGRRRAVAGDGGELAALRVHGGVEGGREVLDLHLGERRHSTEGAAPLGEQRIVGLHGVGRRRRDVGGAGGVDTTIRGSRHRRRRGPAGRRKADETRAAKREKKRETEPFRISRILRREAHSSFAQ